MITALMVSSTVTSRDEHVKAVMDMLATPSTDGERADWQAAQRATWGLADPVYVAQEQALASLDMGDIDAELRRMTGDG